MISYRSYYSNNEQGATLIIVLMVVLLISMVGAIAVRNSQVSLDMTTSSQANQLLFQSSDVALSKLQMLAIEPSATTGKSRLYEVANDNNSPIGMLRIPGSKLREYVICYQPMVVDGLYQPGKHRIITETGATDISAGETDGFCKVSNESSKPFTSSRGTVATQIAITRPTLDGSDVLAEPLQHFPIGTDLSSGGFDDSAYFRAYVTSVLPILSISSSTSDIETCLKQPIGGLAGNTSSDNQIECLAAEDAPFNIQVQDYAYYIEPR